ncbi:hypothetical protein N7501_005997 [Penicillium viridicatum]|nr:hypothetical protein N7501_005997 [Penicillium viridicatum]
MLRLAAMAAIKQTFQALGIISSPGDKEEETGMKELDSRKVDDGKDRLKVKWFSEIPRCSVRRCCSIIGLWLAKADT